MFIIELSYITSLDQVDQYLDSHRQFLDQAFQAGLILISGRKSPRTGGFIISFHQNAEDLQNWLKNDPFWVNQIADFKITEFTATQYHPALVNVIKNLKDEICQS